VSVNGERLSCTRSISEIRRKEGKEGPRTGKVEGTRTCERGKADKRVRHGASPLPPPPPPAHRERDEEIEWRKMIFSVNMRVASQKLIAPSLIDT